jgi:hypothetical protein
MNAESLIKLGFVKDKLRTISNAMRELIPELGAMLDECADELFDIELTETVDAIVETQEEMALERLFGVDGIING